MICLAQIVRLQNAIRQIAVIGEKYKARRVVFQTAHGKTLSEIPCRKSRSEGRPSGSLIVETTSAGLFSTT